MGLWLPGLASFQGWLFYSMGLWFSRVAVLKYGAVAARANYLTICGGGCRSDYFTVCCCGCQEFLFYSIGLWLPGELFYKFATPGPLAAKEGPRLSLPFQSPAHAPVHSPAPAPVHSATSAPSQVKV